MWKNSYIPDYHRGWKGTEKNSNISSMWKKPSLVAACKKGIKNLFVNQCLQAISWTKVGTWQGFKGCSRQGSESFCSTEKAIAKRQENKVHQGTDFAVGREPLGAGPGALLSRGGRGSSSRACPVPSWVTEPHIQPRAPADQLCSQQRPAKLCYSHSPHH